MQVGALYTLEKFKRDPAYRKYLAEEAKSSTNARENLALAKRLEQMGPEGFRQSINAWHYPERLSLEGAVWCDIVWHNKIGGDVQAELGRRAALPPAQRAALDGGPALAPDYPSREAFRAAAVTAGTGHLRQMIDGQKKYLEEQPEVYAKYRARLEEANAITERRLLSLESEPDPAKTRRRADGPPAPRTSR